MNEHQDKNSQGRFRHVTAQRRVERLYDQKCGPLMAWLLEEANLRSMSMGELAENLGVTYGYINQLRNGFRRVSCIGQDFSSACANFLGVPTIIVKLLAGQISMSDFAWPLEDESKMIERAYLRIKEDPMVSLYLPTEDTNLSLESKRALVLLYSEVSENDILGMRNLPWILQHLQRAAMIHNDNEVESLLRCEALMPQYAEEN